MDSAVVDDAFAVRRAVTAQRHCDAGLSAGGHVALETELHTALERQAVVVKGKEDNFIQVLARSSVFNIH